VSVLTHVSGFPLLRAPTIHLAAPRAPDHARQPGRTTPLRALSFGQFRQSVLNSLVSGGVDHLGPELYRCYAVFVGDQLAIVFAPASEYHSAQQVAPLGTPYRKRLGSCGEGTARQQGVYLRTDQRERFRIFGQI